MPEGLCRRRSQSPEDVPRQRVKNDGKEGEELADVTAIDVPPDPIGNRCHKKPTGRIRRSQHSSMSMAALHLLWSLQTSRGNSSNVGFFDRLFLANLNRRFAEHAQLAARAACLVVLVGTPSILPTEYKELHLPRLQLLQMSGVYGTATFTLFLYTLDRSIGRTIYLAWTSILGSFLATLTIWLMFGIFPGGVASSTPLHVFLFGILVGILFVIMILWLNFDCNTKIFGLSNFVFFWMAFLDPTANAHKAFGHGFKITSQGTEWKILLNAFSGSALAVLVTLVPSPIWALGKARDMAHELVASAGVLWFTATTLYCDKRKYDLEIKKLTCDMRSMLSSMQDMDALLDSSWWECFGVPARNHSRLMLIELSHLLKESHDILYCVLNSVMMEEFDSAHTLLVEPIKPHIEKVRSEAHALLKGCVDAACRGGISASQEGDTREAVSRMRCAISDLTVSFMHGREELGKSTISEDFLDEHNVCFSVCTFGRLVSDYAEKMLESKDAAQTDVVWRFSEPPKVCVGVFSSSVLLGASHANFLCRNAISTLLSFYIGYMGVTRGGHAVLKSYSAGISGTTSVLLSRFSGSAAAKNLQRLQGVVLGTVVGHLVHALVGRCVWWGFATTALLLFLWVSLNLYIYFDCPRYATRALLFCVFGTQIFLTGCNEEAFDPLATYYVVADAVVAILVMASVDVALAPSRASDMACDALFGSWQAIEHATGLLLDPGTKKNYFHRSDILQKIQEAEALGMEAEEEPRFWRTPWKGPLFLDAVHGAYRVCSSLSRMEHRMNLDGCPNAPKAEVFVEAFGMRSFQKIENLLQKKMSQLTDLLEVFAHEVDEPMKEFHDHTLQKSYLKETQEARQEFIEEMNRLMARSPKSKSSDSCVATLEADPVSQLSMILSNIDIMMLEMRKLQGRIFKSS